MVFLHISLACGLRSDIRTPGYVVQGNVLVSFNNRPISEAVPGGIPQGVDDVLTSVRQAFPSSPLEFIQEVVYKLAFTIFAEKKEEGGGGKERECVCVADSVGYPCTQTVASINELGSELRPGIQQIDSVLLELSNGVREFR